MSLAVHIPWVASAKSYEDRHSSSYNLEAINKVVAPITWAFCLFKFFFFAKKLSSNVRAK